MGVNVQAMVAMVVTSDFSTMAWALGAVRLAALGWAPTDVATAKAMVVLLLTAAGAVFAGEAAQRKATPAPMRLTAGLPSPPKHLRITTSEARAGRATHIFPLACGRLELGLWPCGRLEGKWLWMGTRSTTMMIAICFAFRPPSGSMRTIDFLHAGFLVIR